MTFQARTNAWKAELNRRGPWVLAAAVVGIAVIYEIAKHHSISKVDVVYFVGLIIAIVLHEVSHGFVAYLCGDDTAKKAKRLTLNPIRHIDLFGSIILPIFMILTAGFAFGWAKPVPVTINKLRHPRNQAVLVALAGPATNIILALIAGFAFKEVESSQLAYLSLDQWPILDIFLFLFGEVNVLLACFNLLPIPPLDGSAILERVLPREMLPGYYRLRMFSMVLVLAVVFLFPGFLDSIATHALTYWANIVGLN